MKQPWDSILTFVEPALSKNSVLHSVYIFEIAKNRVSSFKAKYQKEYIRDQVFSKYVDYSFNFFNLAREVNFAFYLTNNGSANLSDKIDEIILAILLLNQNLEEYLKPEPFWPLDFTYSSMTMLSIHRFLSAVTSNEFSYYAKGEDLKNPLLLEKFKFLQQNVKSLLDEIDNIAIRLGLIPTEVDGDLVYLSPISAEGKAIQRVDDFNHLDKWVDAVERDEVIDLDDLDRKIRESGYLA